MSSRLTRYFILVLFCISIISPQAYSQNTDVKPKGAITSPKRIKSLSLDEKLLAITCINNQYIEKYKSTARGVVYFNLEQNIEDSAQHLRRFICLDSIAEYAGLPVPNHPYRKHIPANVVAAMGANFSIDLSKTSSITLFFGIDTLDYTALTTAYSTIDDLPQAIEQHDLIYLPDNPQIVINALASSRSAKKTDKALAKKLRVIATLTGNEVNQLPNTDGSKEIITNWLKDTYLETITYENIEGLSQVANAGLASICSFSFTPEKFDEFQQTLTFYGPISKYKPGSSPAVDLFRLSAYDLVILPVASLEDTQIEFIDTIKTLTNVLLVSFGPPDSISRAVLQAPVMIVPEDNWFTQSLAAQHIFISTFSGDNMSRLAYGLPEMAGMSEDSLRKIDKIVEMAIHERAIPGCQLLVARNGIVILDKAYGYQTYDSIMPVTTNTLYDLASITKVLATTQAMMYLVENSLISLDEPLSTYLPALQNTNKEKISCRQILAHQAGLYPYFPFWKRVLDELELGTTADDHHIQVGKSLWEPNYVEDSIISWAAQSAMLAERIDTISHEQYFYSDVGFILLKTLIEQKTGQPIEDFLANFLYRPLGIDLTYNPTCMFGDDRIAPTEQDHSLRHELVRGFVHDRNAALMGGVGGQAGLFGKANDVAVMLQLQLNDGRYGDRQYFKAETIKQFLSRQYDNNRRALGWDRPGPEPDGPVSLLASDDTFGHTGFTGGSIWADPQENLIFVFLSNRVHPSENNSKLIDMNIRTQIQDLVYKSIIK